MTNINKDDLHFKLIQAEKTIDALTDEKAEMRNENVTLNSSRLWWKKKAELYFKLLHDGKTIDALTDEKEEMRRIMTNINKDELTKTIESYLETVSTKDEEWYLPVVEIHAKVLAEFRQWVFSAEIEKEARRKQWETLNQEFGAKHD